MDFDRPRFTPPNDGVLVGADEDEHEHEHVNEHDHDHDYDYDYDYDHANEPWSRASLARC